MASPIKFKVDMREFNATLREYTLLSSRDPKVITDTKGFYIARRATVETPAVSAGEIREFLKRDDGAIIGRIINKLRAEHGEKGLYGKAMTKAIAIVRAARLRSRSFLKSGWIPGIKILEPLAERRGIPRVDRSAKVIGRPKGTAIPANSGWRALTRIINTATARWDKQELAASKAEPALQRAFNAETQSMKDYIERKQRETAKRAGVRTN